MADDKIDIKEARQALLRSGYLLESRIEALLGQAGYLVEANYPYPDPATGISRELDVHATAMAEVNVPRALGVFGTLLIECINNPQPIALITKEQKERFPHSHPGEIKLSGIPAKLMVSGDPEKWVPLTVFFDMPKHHHYYEGRIASQFCSFVRKKASGPSKGEWMALHDDRHFDSFKKLSDVVEYEIDRSYRVWLSGENRLVNIEFYYPIVVAQGELFDVRATKRSVRVTKANHLRFQRSCVSGNRQRVYIIDIVRESFFKKFLGLVRSEIDYVARCIEKNEQLSSVSLDKIVDQVLSMPNERRRHAAESTWFRPENGGKE